MIRRLLLLAVLSLMGCSRDSVLLLSAAPEISEVSAEDAKVASPMAVGIVPTFLADAVTYGQLSEDIHRNANQKFPARWYYIGSDANSHYVIGFFFLEPRRLYKILRSECQVPTEIDLTTDDSRWREFNSLGRVAGECFTMTYTRSPFAEWQHIDELKVDMLGESGHPLFDYLLNPPEINSLDDCYPMCLESKSLPKSDAE